MLVRALRISRIRTPRPLCRLSARNPALSHTSLAPQPKRTYGTTQKTPQSPSLFEAVNNRDIKELLELYRHDPTAFFQTGDDGANALHFAATCPDSALMVELLIATGTPIDSQTIESKKTPLHLAAEYKNLGAMKILIQAGADMSKKNKEGKTPLELMKKQPTITIDDVLKP